MTHIAPGRYYLLSESGRALEADANRVTENGCKIATWKLYHGLNQIWDIRERAEGQYYLINVAANKALDAVDVEVDHETGRLQLWQHIPANRNQHWTFLDLGGGWFSLRCVASTRTQVVQLVDDVIDRSAVARLGSLDGSISERWRLVRSDNAAIVRDNLVDLRANQTPIKDQGSRTTCTYFGATAALEAAHRRAGYGDLNLSEEYWSIMGKAMWLHPRWEDYTGANYRENQFGGTGGGGDVRWYKRGFRVPLEDAAPYRPVDYTPSNWDTRDQRVTNDFNFSLLTRPLLQAPQYFGARECGSLTGADLHEPSAYERLLRLGYEIVINCTRELFGGPHNVLIVGFDRTDPANPQFMIKNSWGPLGASPVTNCLLMPYAAVMHDVNQAGYVLDPTGPTTWPELAFLGRWQLNFDGHQGQLDIYHVPGVSVLADDVPGTVDRRVGVFYDRGGKAYRVNGSMIGNRLEFWFSGAKPSLRWDELLGRRFEYYLEPSLNLMTGFHSDNDGSNAKYGGLAVKGVALSATAPARQGFDALAEATWEVLLGTLRGSATFGLANGDNVRGTLTLPNRSTRAIEASRQPNQMINFWIEGESGAALALPLNHAPGLIAGHTSNQRPFYARFLSRS